MRIDDHKKHGFLSIELSATMQRNLLTMLALADKYEGGGKNNIHQSLDMVLDEDHFQIRQQNEDQNMSILCYAFSNVLSSDKNNKFG